MIPVALIGLSLIFGGVFYYNSEVRYYYFLLGGIVIAATIAIWQRYGQHDSKVSGQPTSVSPAPNRVTSTDQTPAGTEVQPKTSRYGNYRRSFWGGVALLFLLAIVFLWPVARQWTGDTVFRKSVTFYPPSQEVVIGNTTLHGIFMDLPKGRTTFTVPVDVYKKNSTIPLAKGVTEIELSNDEKQLHIIARSKPIGVTPPQ